MNARPRKLDATQKQIDALTAKLPQLDAAVEAARTALDDALVTGSDTRPYRGHLRMTGAARTKAERALADLAAQQQAERQSAIVAAARAIEAKAEAARKKLLARFEFSLELPA